MNQTGTACLPLKGSTWLGRAGRPASGCSLEREPCTLWGHTTTSLKGAGRREFALAPAAPGPPHRGDLLQSAMLPMAFAGRMWLTWGRGSLVFGAIAATAATPRHGESKTRRASLWQA